MLKWFYEQEKKGSEKKRRFARFVFKKCTFRFCDYRLVPHIYLAGYE